MSTKILKKVAKVDHVVSMVIMMIVNISEAKANLSKLVDRAYHGEKIVITKNNRPLVDRVVHKPEGKRKLGFIVR